MEHRAYLREYRQQTGLTLKQVAERMGVVAQTIHKWEQGQNSPSIPDLIRLATVYAIPPSAFFQSPDEKPDSDDDRVEAAGSQTVPVSGTLLLTRVANGWTAAPDEWSGVQFMRVFTTVEDLARHVSEWAKAQT